jgi:hypothetical protein
MTVDPWRLIWLIEVASPAPIACLAGLGLAK